MNVKYFLDVSNYFPKEIPIQISDILKKYPTYMLNKMVYFLILIAIVKLKTSPPRAK